MQSIDAQLEELRRQQRALEVEMSAHEARHQDNVAAIAYALNVQPKQVSRTTDCADAASDDGGRDDGIAMPMTAKAKVLRSMSAAADCGRSRQNGSVDTKQQKAGSRTEALKRYFDAMSEFPDYQERRIERLSDARPFSFAIRELQRPKSTASRRTEEDAQQREEEIQAALSRRFEARAVPPSTFINKYQLMVEEWCARKEAIRMLAEEKARAAKEQDTTLLFSKEFARRKEEAGIGRSRSQHARDWREKPKPFRAREVPSFVKNPNIEAHKQSEAARAARIKFRAEQMLKLSQQPPRMAGGTAAQQPSERAASASGRQDGAGAGADAAPTAAEANTNNKPLPAKKKASDLKELQKQNPNFTFKPNVKPSVPDFDYLWAKDRVALATRKQQRPPTTAQAFNLCVTRDSTSHVMREIREEEQTGKELRWPYMSERGRVKPSSPIAVVAQRPVGTKAHAMAAEAAYIKLAAAEEAEHRAKMEERALRQRQHDIAKRVRKYLPPSDATHVLQQRVREMRRKFKAESRERQGELRAKLETIRDLPPVFVEPTYLAELAKARASTEQQVLQMLKEHGLADATVSAIMGRAPNNVPGAAPANGTPQGVPAAAAAVAVVQATDLQAGTQAVPTVQPQSLVSQDAATVHAQPVAAAAVQPTKSRSSSTSSSSSSSSSSRSSSSSSSD